jgi:hypothetical protein
MHKNRKQSRTTQRATDRRRIVHTTHVSGGVASDDAQHALLGKLGQYSEDRPGGGASSFYLDYTFGLLVAAVLFGLTFGRTDATSANSFFVNLHAASNRSIPDAIDESLPAVYPERAVRLASPVILFRSQCRKQSGQLRVIPISMPAGVRSPQAMRGVLCANPTRPSGPSKIIPPCPPRRSNRYAMAA